MAVTANKYGVSMKLILNTGVNPDTGKSISKTKTFSNISGEATDDGIFTAAQTLGGLQIHTVTSVQKQEIYELINE